MVTQQEKEMLWEYFGRSKEVNTQTTEIEFTFSCDAINLHINVPVIVEFYVHRQEGRSWVEVAKVSLSNPVQDVAFDTAIRAMDNRAIEAKLWDHLGTYLLEQAA